MKNEVSNQIILFNLIDFVNSNDIVKDDYIGEYHQENRLRPPTNKAKWQYISENFKFSPILDYLFHSFNDAVRNEDYVSAHFLRKEIQNLFQISDDQIVQQGNELLISLKSSCHEYVLFNGFESTVEDVVSYWADCGFAALKTTLDSLHNVREHAYSMELDIIKEEMVISIGIDKKSHPVFLVDSGLAFFSLIDITK